ncbi:unnamed protein product, partial [Mesorhabditis spiculigera]
MSEAGISRSNWLTWAGLAGAAFVGYAIYFDYKRRSAPDYKQKVRENRRRKALRKGGRVVAARGNPMGLPDPRNPASMQAFFLQEVQLGEELMAAGNVEQGALHIANAIILCGQSQQLMTIFEQTLPPEQFAAVLQVLPSARARLADMFETAADDLDQGPVIDGSFIQMSSGEPNFSSEPRRSGIEVTELIDEELE